MRVYVGVQATPQGGASSLSSYIAKSKVDSEREQVTESGVRPLFSAHQDRLTLKEADQTLNPTGRELEKEEVIHVVISPEPGSLDRAGDDPAEKYKAVRETIRATVRVIERVLNVKSLLWIAGFHENTKTPHVHVAVSRWALDAVTEKLRYIKHLPKSLLPHNTEDAGGERRFLVGKIAEVFVSALVQKLKPIRSVQLIDPLHGIDINRSVASRYAQMLHAPTPEQITVGKWLESALMCATGKTGELSRDEVFRQYSELTSDVARIDALAHANGTRPPTAYIAVERLEELINAKAADVQITVSATPLRAEDEKHVSVAAQQTQVAPASPETKPEPLREEEKFARIDQQSQKQIALRQPEKSVNNREGNQESHERRQDVQSQIPKTQEAGKAPTVKTEKPPPVGKFTLLELRNYIQQGNVVLPKPEPLSPAIAQIRPVAITKTDNDDAKVSTPVPIQSTRGASHAIVSTPAEQTNETTDHSHDIPESEEWQIDDHEVRRLAGISFHHLTGVLRDHGIGNIDIGSVLLENGHYFSPNVTRTEADLREAQIAATICLDLCRERSLEPDFEGVTNYLKGEIPKRGSQVPLMEQMNLVRDRLEDLTSPTNRHLFQEYERLHDLYPDIRPTVGYHDLFETRERSHEQTERTRELERDEHER
jgi:hypothetical protein